MLRPFAHPLHIVARCCAQLEKSQTFSYVETDAITPNIANMSRIDLVSKNLLANVFRNCRKRNTVIEKKLCQKITYKYQSFHIAKNILLTFEIFATFAIFLLYFSDSSSL